MKHEEQFDELGRRKLAQREFMFDEAHWEDVQAALNAQRKRRPAAWFWAAALLLISGGALWYGTMEDGAATGTHTSASAVEAKGPTSGTTEPSSAQEPVEPTTTAPVSAEALTELTGTRALAPEGAAPKTPNIGTLEVRPEPVPSAPNERHIAPDPPSTPALIADLEVDTGLTATTGRPTEDRSSAADNASNRNAEQKHEATSAATDEEPTDVVVETQEVASPSNTERTAVSQTANPQNEVVTSFEASIELSDSAATVVVVPVPDSVLSPDPVQPPSNHTWPLEATVWAGPSWTNNKYSGGNSTEWINGVSGEQTWDAGGELTVMRRNFGFGLGAHYATYKERFSQDEVLRHQQELRNSYFFNTIDTTVTIVIDTIIQNDTTYYVTQQVNTTLSVLDWTTDTTTTTVREREAMATRNIVNYLEIPLLLDVHLTQGRWNVGLRGGPTLGILTSQRGPLPGTHGEAPTRFTEMVFGYTARAYVRYGISPAWSIGVEPGLRGHFGNALATGDVTRNNRSLGVMLGLTYRFR